MKQGLMALMALGLAFSATAHAQTTKQTELTKGDLTGTNMEIVVGTIEAAPGTTAVLHTHAGEEAVYVLSGATAVTPDGKPIVFEPGTAEKTLNLLTVHIADRAKPLYIPVKP